MPTSEQKLHEILQNTDVRNSSSGSAGSSGAAYPRLRYTRAADTPSSSAPSVKQPQHSNAAAAAAPIAAAPPTAAAAAAAAATAEAPHRPADAAGGVGYAAVTVFLIYLKAFDVGPADVHGAAPYCIVSYASATVLSFVAWQFRSETASALSLVAQQGINMSLNLGDWPFTGQSIALGCWFWALGLIAANHFAVRAQHTTCILTHSYSNSSTLLQFAPLFWTVCRCFLKCVWRWFLDQTTARECCDCRYCSSAAVRVHSSLLVQCCRVYSKQAAATILWILCK
jgi:hypothetical protein